MSDMVKDVLEFHQKFGVPSLDTPGFPSPKRVTLRIDLIREEFSEFQWAIDDRDLPATADAIADLIYVLIGTAHEFGIPLEPIWDAVQASNMAKEGGATREDGKILKPPGWSAPDIAGILRAHGWAE